MLDTSNSIALTAFIVSLVALTVTLLQLLQQYSATAQGYNRCSRRLVGDWSRFRHRHYLRREFQFEITFTSWAPFLTHLQEYNRHAARRMHHATYDSPSPSTAHSPSLNYGICIKFEPYTWDDLPGNTGRLIGSVSLRDLTVFTRLLGLAWSDGPFLSNLQSSASREEIKTDTSLSPRGSLQASGNTLILAEESTPPLR
ncbi:hypothetical protein ASPACDRAFT_44632 [Aspergillus aculeatus ATCC 16872]|uniref:Uncharacterized protein n=1 Tax=Aspergillus aculeatus (strain ATCC 16872 / CBS 172.66 / WB 5094) TaxID=690307 RepID=A0A1L9WS74_ASPA1|nr:uncharacterized protein ASPACDRAFT_44632 [Aspergillus aculeatus ATCC 16872]OJJ99004.1 hypothetical protein ASPACDRAFT_44632 [Aspergillus aculeatus ATCC 16872]